MYKLASNEEKKAWLEETYNYIKKFDFKKLDKYKEANEALLIDDIILDYTMLYEYHIEEIERLNNIITEAIEYIESNSQYDDNIEDYWTTTNKLLDILQGSDKEWKN